MATPGKRRRDLTSSQTSRPAKSLSAAPGQGGLIAGICLFLAVLTFAVFARTLSSGFVEYDDGPNVYENPWVTNGLTSAGFAHAFTHGSQANWDPLTTISHMADCQLYGLHPAGHHLTNVLLHAASVVLLFLVLRRMTGAIWPSVFVAAVFAIHPLRVESVAWVSERKDVLSGFFFMLTLWGYARYAEGPPRLSRYLTVVLWFMLGLMSKAMLVTLPMVLLLLDYWPLKRFPEPGDDGKPRAPLLRSRVLLEKIPLLALSLASGVVALFAQHSEQAIQSFTKVPFTLRLENAVVSTAGYIWQMFWPARLAVLYPYPVDGLPVWKILLAVGLLVIVSAAAFRFRRSQPSLAMGWFWYLVMLGPVIGLVQLGQQGHADRYTYLPQIGVYVALAWLVARWAAGRRYATAALGLAAGAAVGALSLCANLQTSYWHDTERLWSRALACTTNNPVAHYGLGLVLLRNGERDAALNEFQTAVDLAPDYAEARNNLGYILFQEGRVPDALAQFEKVLQFQPDYAENHNNLGLVFHSQGRLDDAIKEYREALRLKPDYPEVYFNLGNIFFEQGKINDAIAEYEQAIKLQPDGWQARNNLGTLLFRQGRVGEAIAQFEAVLRIQPGQPQAREMLRGIAWSLATSPETAKRDGATAMKLSQELTQIPGGGTPMELTTLAAAYAETGRFPEAATTAERARQLATAQTNAPLANALQEQISLYQSNHPLRAVASESGGTGH